MINVVLQFPGGKCRAFTLSYDDGVESDFRLADLMRKNGVKGTFNINTGVPSIRNDTCKDPTAPRARMSRTRFLEFYEKNRDIAEIAAHGLTHAFMPNMEQSAATWEVISDRKNLEDLLKQPCRGFAYPYGAFNDETVQALACSGFHYARTTQVTRDFSIPKDPLRWAATCRHQDKNLMELANQFLSLDPENGIKAPYFFSVWGHSYEFNLDDNWEVMENLLSLVGNRDDIWYATNIEFFDYYRAYKSLEFFADQSAVYNPSAISVDLMLASHGSLEKKYFTVHPGEIVKIID